MHQHKDPRQLENLCYLFANGEDRTVGTPTGKSRGGGAIGGTLLLCGEAMPEFRNTGSNRRVLWIDCEQYHPLGAPHTSELGAGRARLLEQAWRDGAGYLGQAVAGHLWADWSATVAAVRLAASDRRFKSLGAWADALAAAVVALRTCGEHCGLAMDSAFLNLLVDRWIEILNSREAHDPAAEAYDKLAYMILSGEREKDGRWEICTFERERIAFRAAEEEWWRVPTSSNAYASAVGKSAAQLYGSIWAQRGWIVPFIDAGKPRATRKVHIPGGNTGLSGSVNCIQLIIKEEAS